MATVGQPLFDRRVRVVGFTICLVLTMGPACSEPPAPPAEPRPAGSIEFRGAGSTFSAPLLTRWRDIYHQSHPATFMKYEAVGSGEGVRRFIGKDLKAAETIDFGASDSAMSDAQLAAADGDTLMLPITGGCIALAYHLPHLQAALRLSRAAYSGVFLGEIGKWNDPRIAKSNPNVSLPDLPIGRMVREDSSGTTFAFSSHLAAISDIWRNRFPPATHVEWSGDVLPARGNEGVAGLVKNYDGSIGYVGLEFAQKLKLDLAELENKTGQFVQPSPQACSVGLSSVNLPDDLRAFVTDPDGADAYPIVTLSWVLLRVNGGDASVKTVMADFFRWCLQDGQKYAAGLGYASLPLNVVDKALRALEREASTDGGGEHGR